MSENEFIRPDGRKTDEMRNLEIEVGILDRADGSARVRLGKNLAIATVFGPREMHPKHESLSNEAQIRINYRMATFSVVDYKKPYPSRREKEISKVLSEAFQSVIISKLFPRSAIDVHVEIFQSDGGTRTAAAIACSAALADAGIPMRDLTGGIASGIYDDHIVLDLCGTEDMKGTGDMPILYSPSIDEVSLFQLDGMFTFEQFKKAFYSSVETIKFVVSKIQDALKEKYIEIRNEILTDEEEAEVSSPIEASDLIEEDKEETFSDEVSGSEEFSGNDYNKSNESMVSSEITESKNLDGSSYESQTEMQSTSLSESSQPEGEINENKSENMETTSKEDQQTGSSDENEDDQKIWYNEPSGLRPMKPSTEDEDNSEDEDSEENDEDVMRDIEYLEDD